MSYEPAARAFSTLCLVELEMAGGTRRRTAGSDDVAGADARSPHKTGRKSTSQVSSSSAELRRTRLVVAVVVAFYFFSSIALVLLNKVGGGSACSMKQRANGCL